MTTVKAEPRPKPPPAVPLRDLGHMGASVLRDHKEWAHLATPWREPVVMVVTLDMLDQLYACDENGVAASDGVAFMTEEECQALVDEWCAGLDVLPATRFQWAASRLMPPVRTTGRFSHVMPEDDMPWPAAPTADEMQRASADRLEQWGVNRADTESFTCEFDRLNES